MDEELIEFVRKNPFLYDKTHREYKNFIARERKWSIFARQSNKSVGSVKKRWKTIRDRYHRLLKTTHCSNGTPATPHKYKYWNQLKFLHESEMDQTIIRSKYIQPEDDSDAISSISVESSSTFSVTSSSKPKKPKGSDKNDEVQQPMLGAIKDIQSTNKCQTAISLFFESLAMQIENAHLSCSAYMKLQTKILLIVQQTISQQTK